MSAILYSALAWIPGVQQDSSGVVGAADELVTFMDYVALVLTFIFSWIVLLSIAIIVSGKLLASRFPFEVSSKQLFGIHLGKTLVIEANNDEVVLGFSGFIITLLFVGLLGGQGVYELFTDRFGIDPGQFNSLCVFSSFILVVVSTAVWLLFSFRRSVPKEIRVEHKELIETLASESQENE